MEKAYLGYSDELVTADEFHIRVGANYREKEVFPICPSCGERLAPYGVNSTNVTSRFDHFDRHTDADPLDDCIYSNRNDSRFKGLEPSGWDKQHGMKLRKQFFEADNLRIAYSFMQKWCCKGNLKLDDFKTCIRRADQKNIWAYSGIPAWSIPYILLTLYTAPCFATPQFCFYFDKPKKTNASILWLHPSQCFLVKVFPDSKKLWKVEDNPFPLSSKKLLEKAGDSSWIKEYFLHQLMEL